MSNKLFEELKLLIESLTDEEKKITDFTDFDLNKYKHQFDIVGWDQNQITERVKDLIEGIHEDLKIYKEDQKLGQIPIVPVLLKRYLDLTDDWRLYIRSRVAISDDITHETFIAFLGQLQTDILDVDDKFNDSNQKIIKLVFRAILEVENVY